jgi:hypothetical protein
MDDENLRLFPTMRLILFPQTDLKLKQRTATFHRVDIVPEG